jgi:starvation-inducible DNA-binding protein
MNEELVISLKKTLADTFTFYLKTHNYHWNVEGPDFFEYLTLFEAIYVEVYGAVDLLAEEIRKLDSYTPGSLERFKMLTTIPEDAKIPTAMGMAQNLLESNSIVLDQIAQTYDLAEQAGVHGLSNLLAERQDAHTKHAWFLRSSLKNR